jgi:hypothetical protein
LFTLAIRARYDCDAGDQTRFYIVDNTDVRLNPVALERQNQFALLNSLFGSRL